MVLVLLGKVEGIQYQKDTRLLLLGRDSLLLAIMATFVGLPEFLSGLLSSNNVHSIRQRVLSIMVFKSAEMVQKQSRYRGKHHFTSFPPKSEYFPLPAFLLYPSLSPSALQKYRNCFSPRLLHFSSFCSFPAKYYTACLPRPAVLCLFTDRSRVSGDPRLLMSLSCFLLIFPSFPSVFQL